MIVWANPAAFIGLALVAGPVLVHLLRRRRSRRVAFPSLRFVQPSPAAALRLYTPAEWPLLVLRIAIVALAVCALAQPLFITSRRLASWNSRVARAVIVDRSTGSASSGGGPAAEPIVDAELRSATFPVRIDAVEIGEALSRAAGSLTTAPPARREIVLVSPIRRGRLDTADIARVPASIGLRFAEVDARAEPVTFPGMILFGYDDVGSRRHSIALDENTTAVALEPASQAQGLRIIAPQGAERDVARLLRAVALAGSPAPSPEQPIAVFLGGEVPQTGRQLTAPWMVKTLSRMTNDLELQRVVGALATNPEPRTRLRGRIEFSPGYGGQAASRGWILLLCDRERRPLLSAAAAESVGGREELLLHTPAPAGSFSAAVIVRAALAARHGAVAIPGREIARIPASQLQAWTRAAAPVTREEAVRAGFSDARWAWGLVLLLLGVETIVRRIRADRAEHVDANAA